MILNFKRKTYCVELELRCKITGNDTMSIYNAKNVSVLSNVIGDIIMITVIAIGGLGITFVVSLLLCNCFSITSLVGEYFGMNIMGNIFFTRVLN